MITTQKEKAFAAELKELMAKYEVRVEETEVCNETDEFNTFTHKFTGPDIDIDINDFELWRNISLPGAQYIAGGKNRCA